VGAIGDPLSLALLLGEKSLSLSASLCRSREPVATRPRSVLQGIPLRYRREGVVVETDEAELIYFHDLEWCEDCKVMICHSCSPDECSLNFDEDDREERVL